MGCVADGAAHPYRCGMAAFEEKRLRDMLAVGDTGRSHTRVWVRSSEPGTHELEIREEGTDGPPIGGGRFEVSEDPRLDGTTSVVYPQDFPGGQPLCEGARYRVRVAKPDGSPIGTGRLETAWGHRRPDTVEATYGFMSCHQPFDDDGEISDAAKRALAILEPAFAQRRVRRLVLTGDQVYADLPSSRSLFDPEYFAGVAPPGRESIFDCTVDEVRALYQERHRIFWQTPAFRAVQASCPTTCILDDHEIRDNFGTAPEHGSPEWHDVREGAFLAFDDYQGLRTHGRGAGRPPSFHYGFVDGPTAIFVMDLRTHKCVQGDHIQIYGPDQHADLTRFLEANGQRPVCIVVVTVPIVHVPNWLAEAAGVALGKASDAQDRWAHPKAERSRRQLLSLLAHHLERHPHQRLILVGGDIHAGMVASLRFREKGLPEMVQFVSSAITNLETAPVRFVSGQGPRLVHRVSSSDDAPELDVELLDDGRGQNPFAGLNCGFIRVRGPYDHPTVTLELVSDDGGETPRPRTVFELDVPPA